MSKFSKRLRYSVGGTYRWYGPGKSLSVDKGSPASFLSSQKGLRRKAIGWLIHPTRLHFPLPVLLRCF